MEKIDIEIIKEDVLSIMLENRIFDGLIGANFCLEKYHSTMANQLANQQYYDAYETATKIELLRLLIEKKGKKDILKTDDTISWGMSRSEMKEKYNRHQKYKEFERIIKLRGENNGEE